ncbi:MAG TPA: RNA polymerase sporulation sigma factor SigK [Bacilli bacterium]|nr:RNA polymerase sporulation sigma factor SigK [Bacilli bacterium]
MFKKLLSMLFKDFYIFSCAYSNNIFPDPLTKEDEAIYIDRMMNNDKDARNILIEHNLRLVAHIVKKYENKKDNIDDLISIGTIGLIKGIDSYSNNKGIKLTTYAARCIENEVLMFYRADKKNSKNISLNESIGFDKDGNEITFLDILKTPKPDYALDIHNKDNIKLLKKYFKTLNNREKEILIKRYGLNNNDEITQKEIAKDMNISRSYVSRIEKRALTKILREFIKNKNS